MAEPFNETDVVRKTYFINESERDSVTPANDAGKVPQLESDGFLSPEFLGGWELLDTWTYSSNTVSIDFTNLPNIAKIARLLVVLEGVTADGSSIRNVLFSEDNGATFLTTNKYAGGGGFSSNTISLSSSTGVAVYAWCELSFVNTSNYKLAKTTNSSQANWVVDSTAPINAVRVTCGNVMTGGSIKIYGIRNA